MEKIKNEYHWYLSENGQWLEMLMGEILPFRNEEKSLGEIPDLQFGRWCLNHPKSKFIEEGDYWGTIKKIAHWASHVGKPRFLVSCSDPIQVVKDVYQIAPEVRGLEYSYVDKLEGYLFSCDKPAKRPGVDFIW